MTKRPFYQFSSEDDRVWALLFARQLPQVQRYACKMYLDGLKALDLPEDRVPNFERIDALLQERVGWELVSTDVQYSDGQEWFEHLAQRKFLITEYIRPMASLDYTPMPDIWHDVFGHLPYMVHQDYADYLQAFGERAIEFSPQQRKGLGSLWWYGIEFGLVREEGETKAFGAGLMSSYEELARAFNEVVVIEPYSIDVVQKVPPSPHEMHTTLYQLVSFQHMRDVLEDWYTAHSPQAILAS